MKLIRDLALVLAGFAVLFFVGAVLMSSGASKPSSPAQDDGLDNMKRVMAEDFLISMQRKCLPEPLTEAQIQYLSDGTEYLTQRYLLALASDGRCLDRALHKCESINPGQCVAVAGEVRGKRP